MLNQQEILTVTTTIIEKAKSVADSGAKIIPRQPGRAVHPQTFVTWVAQQMII